MTDRRDWRLARHKVEQEGSCRVCGARPGERIDGRLVTLEAAHTAGREHDRRLVELAAEHEEAGRFEHSMADGYDRFVNPDDVVALCGPAADSRSCHHRYDARQLDLLPYLTRAEEVGVVYHLGIAGAVRRLCAGARIVELAEERVTVVPQGRLGETSTTSDAP